MEIIIIIINIIIIYKYGSYMHNYTRSRIPTNQHRGAIDDSDCGGGNQGGIHVIIRHMKSRVYLTKGFENEDDGINLSLFLVLGVAVGGPTSATDC